MASPMHADSIADVFVLPTTSAQPPTPPTTPTTPTTVLLTDIIDEHLQPGGVGEALLDVSSSTWRAVNMHVQRMGWIMTKVQSVPEQDPAITTVLIRRNLTNDPDFIEGRVSVLGNVDSGKSTLISCLTYLEEDDGNGAARAHIVRHKHEDRDGRTSTCMQNIMGFDAAGNIVNVVRHNREGKVVSRARDGRYIDALDWPATCNASTKLLTFVDLPGHEKYMHTTVGGLTSSEIHHAMLVVGANHGAQGTLKEHMKIVLGHRRPFFIVVTKIDLAPANVLERTLEQMKRSCTKPGLRRPAIVVQTMDDVVTAAKNIGLYACVPIFQVSNVTQKGMDLLRAFLNLLPITNPYRDYRPVRYQIETKYRVSGIGTVVSGTLLDGVIRVNDHVWLGPFFDGSYRDVVVGGIERHRLPVDTLRAGHMGTLWLKKVARDMVRRGMWVLAKIPGQPPPKAAWQFDTTLSIFHHPGIIAQGFQMVVNSGTVRQTARIMHIADHQSPWLSDKTWVNTLRTGDHRVPVRIQFTKKPELLFTDMRIMVRERNARAVGVVVQGLTGEEHGGPAHVQPPPSEKREERKRERNRKRRERKKGTSAFPGASAACKDDDADDDDDDDDDDD